MHELRVTEDILRVACEEGQKLNAARVTDIYLSIGKISSIEEEAVRFHWDQISKSTLCDGANLHFNRPPAILVCQKCGASYELIDKVLPCPKCGAYDLDILSGNEMQVDEIEIETKNEDSFEL